MTDKIDIDGKASRFGWFVLAVIVFGGVIAIRTRLHQYLARTGAGDSGIALMA